MASILNDIIEQSNVKHSVLRVKVPEELKDKIEFICNETGVDKDMYITAILEKSEISKVFKELLKKAKTEQNSFIQE